MIGENSSFIMQKYQSKQGLNERRVMMQNDLKSIEIGHACKSIVNRSQQSYACKSIKRWMYLDIYISGKFCIPLSEDKVRLRDIPT